MKRIFALTLIALLVAGCSDANPQAPVNDNGGNTGQDDNNNDSGGSGSGDSDGNGDGSDDGDSGGGSDDGDSGGDSGSAEQPEPDLVKFTGDVFGYPRIHTNYYVSEENEHLSFDPREKYTVWASSYLQAHSLLETMHAINAYRSVSAHITTINGESQNMNSLISDYCPASGTKFLADRCRFYAKLAYDKTMAQDGWQTEHRLNGTAPVICGSINLRYVDCSYSLLGNTGRVATYNGLDLVSTRKSPIEGWQYENNAQKIIAINKSVIAYLKCALSDDDFRNYRFIDRAALSPWPREQLPWTDTKMTRYGQLTIWIISNDVVEDVYADVLAEHDGSNSCKASFQLDLKKVQPSAVL